MGSGAGTKVAPGMASSCCCPEVLQTCRWHQGHSREGTCTQQSSESPVTAPVYHSMDEVAEEHKCGLRATQLKPAQEEMLPGTFYSSCRSLPMG